MERVEINVLTTNKNTRSTFSNDNLYNVEERPPFVLSFLNALQIIISQVLNIVWLPLLVTPSLCLLPADPARVYLVSTALLTSAVVTSLQSTLGIRLPSLSSPSPLYIASFVSLLQGSGWQCTTTGDLYAMGPTLRAREWQTRLQELQGALLFAGSVQAVLGFTGIQAWLFQILNPVSVAPAIILAGLTMSSQTISLLSSDQWTLTSIVILLMILFALRLRHMNLPLPTFSIHSGITAKRFPVFRMFPVLWTCVAVYVFYKIDSVYRFSPPYPESDVIGYNEAVENSKWFFFPFPFEWGWPTLSLSTAVHILPAVLLQSLTSLVTFYANASTCGLSFPPRPAVSRGLGLEGLGLMLGAFWGHGVTTQLSNTGLMTFTGIVSRSSTQLAALVMICLSHFTYFTAVLANIPIPFLTALQLCLQAGLVCVGISMLRFIKFETLRDGSIVGFSLFLGWAIPHWMTSPNLTIDTGLPFFDSCIAQVLVSPVFVGAVFGIFLDLLLPGRMSLKKTNSWKQRSEEDMKTFKLPTWEELLCSVLDGIPFFSSD